MSLLHGVSTYAIVYKTENQLLNLSQLYGRERNLETTKPLVESNETNDQVSTVTNNSQLGEQANPLPLYGKSQPSLIGYLLTKVRKD